MNGGGERPGGEQVGGVDQQGVTSGLSTGGGATETAQGWSDIPHSRQCIAEGGAKAKVRASAAILHDCDLAWEGPDLPSQMHEVKVAVANVDSVRQHQLHILDLLRHHHLVVISEHHLSRRDADELAVTLGRSNYSSIWTCHENEVGAATHGVAVDASPHLQLTNIPDAEVPGRALGVAVTSQVAKLSFKMLALYAPTDYKKNKEVIDGFWEV
eukprot:6477391-Amphidinium_carterae.1